MNVVNIPISQLREASWNPNGMDEEMTDRLMESLGRFGVVENLVVRPVDGGSYEVVSGNQRLRALKEAGRTELPCVVVDLEDAQSRLLAQALNRIQGEDDLGLKAEMVRQMLQSIPPAEVLSILPESAESLQALASLGEADLAEHLQAWQQAQAARLRHMTFQLANDQLEIVEEAMERAMAGVTHNGSNPTKRGNALFELCKSYLDETGATP